MIDKFEVGKTAVIEKIIIEIVVSRVIYADEGSSLKETFSWMANTEVKFSAERYVNHELITVKLSILELNTIISPWNHLVNNLAK